MLVVMKSPGRDEGFQKEIAFLYEQLKSLETATSALEAYRSLGSSDEPARFTSRSRKMPGREKRLQLRNAGS